MKMWSFALCIWNKGQKLFFLTVLESGAPLSSFLEEVLYKSLNEWPIEGYLVHTKISQTAHTNKRIQNSAKIAHSIIPYKSRPTGKMPPTITTQIIDFSASYLLHAEPLYGQAMRYVPVHNKTLTSLQSRPAVLTLWVAIPAGVAWRLTGDRLRPSEIFKFIVKVTNCVFLH